MSLRVEHLAGHGFSPRVIEVWRRKYSEELLPLQEIAITEYGYLRGENLLVFAPTSSGKTFIGESAALKVLEARGKVVYLVPTKALAEEKYRLFRELYQPLGFRIVISTAERRESDARVMHGEFDLLIAVYEKMRSYLVLHPELLAQVGLVVVDEVQSLGDAERGGGLEVLLTKLKVSPYRCQLIGLSAVLGEAEKIAEWLGCRLLNFYRRPVELREGVFNLEDNQLYYRCLNSGEEGVEQLYPKGKELYGEEENFYRQAVVMLAVHLAQKAKEQVLIFVPTRQLSRQWARQLAESVELPAVEITEWAQLEPNESCGMLAECLRKGVAFHNADLTWDLRQLVEEHYNAGRIRILVSTSTLGQGVNLLGRNVMQVSQMVRRESWTGGYMFVPLSRQLFKNQGGRGGRFGKEEEFGRSFLFAQNKGETERLLHYYIHGKLEGPELPLVGRELSTVVLDLVASRIAPRSEQVEEFLLGSYSGIRHWSGQPEELKAAIEKGLQNCQQKKLMFADEEGTLKASGLGTVVAAKGLRPLTAHRFQQWLGKLELGLPSPLEVLLIVGFTPDGEDFPVPLGYRERMSGIYVEEIRRRLTDDELQRIEPLHLMFDRQLGVDEATLEILKKSVLLEQWIGPRETLEIEREFGVLAGTINNLAGHYNWLLQALAQTARTLGVTTQLCSHLERLADRLVYGVEEEALSLAVLRVQGLSRSYIQRLLREGFSTPAALQEVDEEILCQLLPARLARALKEYLEEHYAPPPEPEAKQELEREATPVLIIDQSTPGLVIFKEKRVKLTPTPYQLLLLLAKKPGEIVSYQEMEEVLWKNTQVERQQASAHKRRLVQALSPHLQGAEKEKLIETRSGFGFMLNLRPEQVVVK